MRIGKSVDLRPTRFLAPGFVVLLLLACGDADAYIGPGAGIGVIGTVIALIGAVILAIIGFVWYPIKRLCTKNQDKKMSKNSEKSDDEPSPP